MDNIDFEEQGPSLEDYIDIARRRKFYFIFTTPIILFIAVAVIMSLPPLYQSQGTILIQGEDIPQEMIRSTVTEFAEKQIETTRQRLMTSAKILDIIEKYNLYPEDRGNVTVSELTNKFKAAASVNMIAASVPGKGRGKTNIAFKVSFLDGSPEKAQLVANELSTLFLEENVKARTGKADDTAKFLEEEADRMQARVQEMENKMAEFKVEYADSLPELLEFNLDSVARIENQIIDSKEELIKIGEKIHSLNIQLSNTSPYMQFSTTSGQASTPRQRLMELRRQYSELSFQYADSHPDIVRLKQEMSLAEDAMKEAQEVSADLDDADNPVYRQLVRQVKSLEDESSRIREQRKQLEVDLKDYNERIQKTHQVKRGYDALTRDHQNKLEKYRELRAKQLEANVAQNMEAENKAGSFKLIEPPIMPDFPVKPARMKLIALAIMVSIGAGIGLMIAVEFLDSGVRGVSSNMKVFMQEPLAVIPHIYNQNDINKRKRNRKYFLIAVGVSFVVSLILFHFLVLELDVLWLKLINKINHL